MRLALQSISVLVLLCLAGTGRAAVTAEEAAALKSELTPLGAIRAGNEAGTIPAWTGGITTGSRNDLFAGEKPLYSITARNFASYADKLPEGAKALFARNSDPSIGDRKA